LQRESIGKKKAGERERGIYAVDAEMQVMRCIGVEHDRGRYGGGACKQGWAGERQKWGENVVKYVIRHQGPAGKE